MVERGAAYEREELDHYPTPDEPISALFHVVAFHKRVCDPCCGSGNIMRFFEARGHKAIGMDVKPTRRSGGVKGDFIRDKFPFAGQFDIVTNPPYGTQGRLGVQFIERSLELTQKSGRKVAMLLPIDFDSASTRVDIFRDHPAFRTKITLLNRIKWFDDPVKCKKCDGSGSIGDSSNHLKCPKCKGKGETNPSPATNHGWFLWDWSGAGLLPVQTYAGW